MRPLLIASAVAVGIGLASCAVRLPEGRLACTTLQDCPVGWLCVESRCYSMPRDASVDAHDAGAADRDAGTEPSPDGGADAAVAADSGISDEEDGGISDAGDDAGSGDGGTPCTRGPDGHCYALVADVSTRAAAQATCEALGGHLVTIGTASEQAVAWTVSMPSGMPAWIGATDEGSEGAWRWTTGETFSARWGATQPDNAGGAEHCAVLWPGFDGAWADVSCASSFPAVCEIP